MSSTITINHVGQQNQSQAEIFLCDNNLILTEQQTLDQETTESDSEALINNIEGKSKRLISWSCLIRNLVTGFQVSIWNCQSTRKPKQICHQSQTEHQQQRQKLQVSPYLQSSHWYV